MRPTLLTVRSKDLVQAERFYCQLGITFTRHAHGGPEHLSAESGGMVFEIYPLASNQLPTSSTRLGFAVENVSTTLQDLVKIGAEVIQTPRVSAWGLRAVVRDGDGHCVELVQREDSVDRAPSA
jgi:lactoylglutathione lyase